MEAKGREEKKQTFLDEGNDIGIREVEVILLILNILKFPLVARGSRNLNQYIDRSTFVWEAHDRT